MLHFVHHLLLRVERLLLEPKGFPNSLTELEGGLVVQQFFSNDKTIFSLSDMSMVTTLLNVCMNY